MLADVRERAHQAARAELAEAALNLMVEGGYEEQTVDDLARALGVSRATFFRYLGSKDEAVVATVLGPAELFAGAYRRALLSGALQGTSAWQQLRASFSPALDLAESEPARMRARLRMVQAIPALGARLRRARAPQVERLAVAMVEHGQHPEAATVLATAAVAVLDQCWVQWQRQEDASLSTILDEAFAHLQAASTPVSI